MNADYVRQQMSEILREQMSRRRLRPSAADMQKYLPVSLQIQKDMR